MIIIEAKFTKKDISNYCSVKEYNSIRKLYEIEAAVRDILEANVE